MVKPRRAASSAKKKPASKKKGTAKRGKRAEPRKRAAAAQRPAAEAVSLVVNVEGYVRALPPALQAIVARVRALVASASPEATESFRWGQPVYESNGPFAYVKAHKSHVNFGFWRGAVLDLPEGVTFEGDGTRMRHLKIADVASILDEPLKSLVRQAVLLNGRLGNPALQRGS